MKTRRLTPDDYCRMIFGMSEAEIVERLQRAKDEGRLHLPARLTRMVDGDPVPLYICGELPGEGDV